MHSVHADGLCMDSNGNKNVPVIPCLNWTSWWIALCSTHSQWKDTCHKIDARCPNIERGERGHQRGWKHTLQGWGGWKVAMVPNSIHSQEKEMRGSLRKQLVDLCYFPEWYCFISLTSGLQSRIKDWKFQDTIELVCFVFVYLYL